MSLVSNAGKTALYRSGLSNYIYKWNYTRCSLIKKATPNRGAAKLLTLLFPSTVSRHFPFPLEQRDSFQESKTFRNSFRFRTKILEKGKIVAFIFLRAKIPPISLFSISIPLFIVRIITLDDNTCKSRGIQARGDLISTSVPSSGYTSIKIHDTRYLNGRRP